jgi:glycosyltransferase involved in cell wall biosynthesis
MTEYVQESKLDVLNFVTNEHASFFQRQLHALEEFGVRSDVVSPRKQYPDDPQDTSRAPLDYLLMYPKIMKTQLKNYDLVHANYGLISPFAIGQFHRPIVLSLWGSDLYGPIEPLVQLSAKLADGVIVMNQGMQERLRTDSTVIPHGIDFDLFNPINKAEARRELNWHSNKKHVLFPYPKSRELKNYSLALEVVKGANTRIDAPIRLHRVYGEPPERMPVYMSGADVLLMTSKREGSPNSIKEALVCNLPIVSTDVGDVSERVDGVSHSYIGRNQKQLVEKLISVLEAEERTNGRSQSKELRLDRMAKRILNLYRKTISNN